MELVWLVGDCFGEGIWLNNIVLFYDSVGEKDEVLIYYKEVLKIF